MWDLGKSVSFVVEKLQGIGDESGCLVFCLISPLPFALELESKPSSGMPCYHRLATRTRSILESSFVCEIDKRHL